jgi:hypothetical protein
MVASMTVLSSNVPMDRRCGASIPPPKPVWRGGLKTDSNTSGKCLGRSGRAEGGRGTRSADPSEADAASQPTLIWRFYGRAELWLRPRSGEASRGSAARALGRPRIIGTAQQGQEEPGTMSHRRLLTTVGAAALGVGVVLGGAATTPLAQAQQATPPAAATTSSSTASQPQATRDQQQKDAYDAFVASLASQLGVDASKVDTAIRTTLKQEIDARQADGDIDKVEAAARKAAIDASDAPLFLGLGGPGGMHGFDGGRGDAGRGPRGGGPGQPAPKPGDDGAANQPGDDGAAAQPSASTAVAANDAGI